jgi:hypothetical protein
VTRLRYGGAALAAGVMATLAVSPGYAFAVGRPRQANAAQAGQSETGGSPADGEPAATATPMPTVSSPAAAAANAQEAGGATKNAPDLREPERPASQPGDVRAEAPTSKAGAEEPPTSESPPTATLAIAPASIASASSTVPRSMAPVSAHPAAPAPAPALALASSAPASTPHIRAAPTLSQRPVIAPAQTSTPVSHRGSGRMTGVLGASTAFLGAPLRAATKLSVPVGLLLMVAVFLILQAGLNRRDPKLADAPATPDDDALSFS